MITAKEISELRGVRRVEVIGGQTLINADCLEVMPELGRFDACVTDPPYGIGADKGKSFSGSKRGDRKYFDGGAQGWDSERPPSEAFDAIVDLSGNQIIWGGNHFSDLLPPSTGWLVWDKGQRISQSDGELAYTNRKSALRIKTLNRVELLKDGTAHPTQKPVAMMAWCLGFLPDAETILDPFMGSGTTLVACQRLGRRGTGIEIDPDYFQIACKRVDEATRQPDLFVAPPETPTQEAMDL